jgi:hypothetical protein
LKPSAGVPRKVAALVSAATMEARTAHQGIDRPPSEKSADFYSPARPQTQRDYAEEIKEQDCGIDCQTGAHVGAYLATAAVPSKAEA